MFAVSLGLVAWSCCAVAPYPPAGRYFVETFCESSTEYALGQRSATFFINRASGNDAKLVRGQFSVKYKDHLAPPPRPYNRYTLWLPHFAPGDRAYWWVEVVDGKIMPITNKVVISETLCQDLDNVMWPIREKSARHGDEAIVRLSKTGRAFGEAMLSITCRGTRQVQEKVLVEYAKSDVSSVAALAKWLLNTHYSVQAAR